MRRCMSNDGDGEKRGDLREGYLSLECFMKEMLCLGCCIYLG